MRLFSTLAVIAIAGQETFADKMNKCAMIPKAGRRRSGETRNINKGTAAPLAISFIQENRETLLNVFADMPAPTSDLISSKMQTVARFADVTGEQLMGQVFRQTKQVIKDTIKEASADVKAVYGEEFYGVYRDNSQRFGKLVRDVVYNKNIIEKMDADLYVVDDIMEVAMKFQDEASDVYKQFLDAHLEEFIPLLKAMTESMTKLHIRIVKDVFATLQSKKRRESYRQMVHDLPKVYQFFNDNIDFIEMQNVDKELGASVTAEILKEIGAAQDKNVANMISRNQKFIKTLIMSRAEKQQQDKVVEKVMGKNKELKENVANQAEFDRLVAEAKKAGEEITNEMKGKLWDQAKQNMKKKQQDQIADQTEVYDKTKHEVKQGLTRYEHLSAIMSLMPDELEQSIAQMVKESCPELDLIQVDTPEMKQIIEEQPENFIDQLIRELHDVCDMFGLIDDSKVVTKVINGVEVQIYADDWFKGEKKQW